MINSNLLDDYQIVRRTTQSICLPLEIEDYVVQSIADVSPIKWHLAHTTWFFETVVLAPHIKNYVPYDPLFHTLFNSYYESLGTPYPRVARGILSRPTVADIYAYRQFVDDAMQTYLTTCSDEELEIIKPLTILGLQHEQQHQELLLMDVKYNFSVHPNFPIYQSLETVDTNRTGLQERFISVEKKIVKIGHHEDGFSFDNERPCHELLLPSYAIANRLVTNSEYLAFIEDGGYLDSRLWLSDGWDCLKKQHWQAPLYWHNLEGVWHLFTLHGLVVLEAHEPVCHLSFYEADAYARWRGKRLPTEPEWEHFASHLFREPHQENFLENKRLHPLPAVPKEQPQQFFGDVWEWTQSAYLPYPGYKPYSGTLGEYNGKFMCNQMVLRGGCCVTPRSHIRVTYRNFFKAEQRWQFSGIRLAEDH